MWPDTTRLQPTIVHPATSSKKEAVFIAGPLWANQKWTYGISANRLVVFPSYSNAAVVFSSVFVSELEELDTKGLKN